MKTRKTPISKRNTYIVYNDRNERVAEYIAGADGVTEEHIKELHRMDDHEVYVNSKEKFGSWISLDATMNSDGEDFSGSSYLEAETAVEYFDKPDSAVDYAREIVTSMPEQSRLVYEYVYIRNMKKQDAAAKLGLSPARITSIDKQIKDTLRSNDILRSYFRCDPEND